MPEAEQDRIHIEELELRVRIGVPDEERATPQRLTASLTLWPNSDLHGLSDELARTVDYGEVARETKSFAESRSDKLIETLAEGIAAHLLAKFPLRKVQIELRKFVLPETRHVAVILTRAKTSQERGSR